MRIASDSERLDGMKPHPFDAAVLDALDLAWQLPRDDLIACEVGIVNTHGMIYRRAALKGVSQVLDFGERMVMLGFEAELEQSEQVGSGFDVIFRSWTPGALPG
jgi:hypothetical protein